MPESIRPAAPPAAAIKLGRAVARPKFREETPKTIIATCAGEAFAGTGVCRCLYMPAGLWNFNLILQCKKFSSKNPVY